MLCKEEAASVTLNLLDHNAIIQCTQLLQIISLAICCIMSTCVGSDPNLFFLEVNILS